jgi:hypothetical protein
MGKIYPVAFSKCLVKENKLFPLSELEFGFG